MNLSMSLAVVAVLLLPTALRLMKEEEKRVYPYRKKNGREFI